MTISGDSGEVDIPAPTPDENVLKQLAGAAFLQNPNFQIVLPSGITLGRDETRVFTELYRAPDNKLNLDIPNPQGIGQYLPDHYFLTFKNISELEHQNKLVELRMIAETMTPEELEETTTGFIGALDKQAASLCIQVAHEQSEAANGLGKQDLASQYSYAATKGEFDLNDISQQEMM